MERLCNIALHRLGYPTVILEDWMERIFTFSFCISLANSMSFFVQCAGDCPAVIRVEVFFLLQLSLLSLCSYFIWLIVNEKCTSDGAATAVALNSISISLVLLITVHGSFVLKQSSSEDNPITLIALISVSVIELAARCIFMKDFMNAYKSLKMEEYYNYIFAIDQSYDDCILLETN